jgi:signal transduction histidine kinase
MEKINSMARELAHTRWLPPMAVFMVVAALGGLIVFGTLQLRKNFQQQLVTHNGEVLDTVAALERLTTSTTETVTGQIENPASQFTLALRLSQIQDGIMAVRLYDNHGRFILSLPDAVCTNELNSKVMAQMTQLRPRSWFESHASLGEVFLAPAAGASSTGLQLPLLYMLIPLHAKGGTNLLAVAELIQDGRQLAEEFAVLDQSLLRQALIAFLSIGGLTGLGLGWAFRRLQQINRQLQAQAASLRRANQELALTAKTSALGAVTAHVIHALTSPLNGLQQFVAARANGDQEWNEALRGTERMQSLLGEVVHVLSEESGDTRYLVPWPEMVQVIVSRIQSEAQTAGVRLEWQCHAHGQLANRDASLLLLILDNLLRNALEATPRGSTVKLLVKPSANGVLCEVSDEGKGIPMAIRKSLFVPVKSTKPGGHGLGLSISQHLARHLGAELRLVRSDESGTVFALDLPTDKLGEENQSVGGPFAVTA